MANIQLSQLIDVSKPHYVLAEVNKLFSTHYPGKSFLPVKKNFLKIQDLFLGNLHGYRECNTEYHDFRHTLDTFLTVARLSDGYNLSHEKYDVETGINLLLAALFHDTGYIQEQWDMAGTGAKYTQEHVKRSTVFVEKNAQVLGLEPNQVDVINSYVLCSHIGDDFDDFSFARETDRTAGAILGTSDLLGQMADRVYLEKLLFLYYEFREARVPGYDTEFDIIKKTLDFYKVVMEKITDSFFNVFEFARVHFRERYKINQNLYIKAIEKNIAYVKNIIADSQTNFREKLHRVNFKQIGL